MNDATPTLCRSVLYVPGSSPKALAKAPTLGADALILDLEDSVAPAAKSDARRAVLDLLLLTRASPLLRTVRINGSDTPLWQEDLEAVLPGEPDAIVVPKVESTDGLLAVLSFLDRWEKMAPGRPHCPLWAMIETPKGVLQALAIASLPRVTALALGTSDLAKELRIRPGRNRLPLLTALSQVILAARAARVLVLDGVFVDLKDDEGFRDQCREAAELGFDGKTIIHPRQVEPANLAFLPTPDELERARRVVATWEAAAALGEEICVVDGQLVERLHARAASRLIALAEAARPHLSDPPQPG